MYRVRWVCVLFVRACFRPIATTGVIRWQGWKRRKFAVVRILSVRLWLVCVQTMQGTHCNRCIREREFEERKCMPQSYELPDSVFGLHSKHKRSMKSSCAYSTIQNLCKTIAQERDSGLLLAQPCRVPVAILFHRICAFFFKKNFFFFVSDCQWKPLRSHGLHDIFFFSKWISLARMRLPHRSIATKSLSHHFPSQHACRMWHVKIECMRVSGKLKPKSVRTNTFSSTSQKEARKSNQC